MNINNNVNNNNGSGIGDQITPPGANNNDGGGISDMFTKLLIAQIQNQDPLAPMEASQFVTQFSQMSQVEALHTLANLSAATAAMQESMLVVTLGSQVGSLVRVRADSVELDGDVVKGGFNLESSASDVEVILTGPDGTEHTISLGAQQAGDVGAGAGAAIGLTLGDEVLQRLGIARAALALPHRRRIGQQAAGGQLLQDELVGAGHAARAVDVFDAHQPGAAMRAGVQPGGQGRHQRAGVQRAGVRGREAAHVRCSAGVHSSRPSCRSSRARRVLGLASWCSHQVSAMPGWALPWRQA